MKKRTAKIYVLLAGMLLFGTIALSPLFLTIVQTRSLSIDARAQYLHGLAQIFEFCGSELVSDDLYTQSGLIAHNLIIVEYAPIANDPTPERFIRDISIGSSPEIDRLYELSANRRTKQCRVALPESEKSRFMELLALYRAQIRSAQQEAQNPSIDGLE